MNAANLAITMAQKGIKTLLIDSDLRRPVLDILFTSSHRKTGLTNYLSLVTHWKECIRETSINNLDLMPAGQITSNAAEMLSTRMMKQFLKEARDAYDILLLDSPPLLPVTDATVLSAFVDSVILVARAGKTERKSIRYALELLTNVGVHIMGSVITGVKASEMSGYKAYNESYYGEPDDRKVRKIYK
jgi:capsular exopolysaccharide synthesis family protein